MAILDELLKAPDAVTTEGNRILASLAAGTYGAQPQQALNAAAGTPQITVAPASSVADFASPTDPFFNQPSLWQQNQDPAQLRQGLRLDELTTRAAAGKFALEQAQQNAPAQQALMAARLAHQQAATQALSTHEKTLLEHDTAGLNATHNFLTALNAPGAPKSGQPGYDTFFKATLLNNGDIVHSTGGRELVKALADKHDASMSIEDLRKQVPPGFDISSMEIGGGKQSHVTTKPTAVAKAHAVSVGTMDDKGNFKGNDTGQYVKLTYADGRTKDKILSVPEYKQLGGQFSPETAKARGEVAQPTDLKALAQKALNDPNSSEEHRAAARKILSGE